MKLDTLSEDEMLLVLGLLSPKELLNCRLVCRRLRDMALHPLLWGAVSLTATPTSSKLAAGALRLAPRLRELVVNYPDTSMRLGLLLASTNCAISALRVAFYPADAVLLALVLGRQAALGRLKRVELSVRCSSLDGKSLSRLQQLLEQLLCIKGLEVIFLSLGDDDAETGAFLTASPVLNAAHFEVPVPASLRELEYFTEFSDPHLPLFLKWHAATLEVVRFDGDCPSAAPLLAGMPRLHWLESPVFPDMHLLLQCPSLKTVHLVVSRQPWADACLAGVAEFLRGAAGRIEDLVLDYPVDDERAAASDLVLSLAGTVEAAPALRQLHLRYLETEPETPQPQLRALSTVLHRLTHLSRLSLNGPPSDEFLDALHGHAVPRLVVVIPSLWACPHQWAHCERVAAALRRCPRLHIVMYFEHEDACEYCEEHSCHELLFGSVTLFSHPVEASCDVEHSETDMCLS